MVGADSEFDVTPVRRTAVRAAGRGRRTRRNAAVAAGVAVLISGVALGTALWLSGDDGETAAVSPSTTSTSAAEVAERLTAPLTGVEQDGSDPAVLARLDRPALVAKVDNDPVAMPQVGLEHTDLVIELQVEGISRYLAVVHSQPAVELGPIRSARTSDPDLLAMFGEPLLAWSGGNPKVTRAIRDAPWIQSVTPDNAESAFSRDRDRRRPHNLMVDVAEAEERAEQPPSLPTPLFSYRSAGEPPAGVPVGGVDLSVGFSAVGFDWDEERGAWMRRSNGRPHLDARGDQLEAVNVVVLETDYVPSAADRRSPEAQTLGSGSAWVFTAGRLIEGRWERDERTEPWRLTFADGGNIRLTPGRTWVELPSTGVVPRVTPAG